MMLFDVECILDVKYCPVGRPADWEYESALQPTECIQ